MDAHPIAAVAAVVVADVGVLVGPAGAVPTAATIEGAGLAVRAQVVAAVAVGAATAARATAVSSVCRFAS